MNILIRLRIIILQIFLNHKDVSINNIKKINKNSIYTYGNNGIYSEEILDNDNTIINRIVRINLYIV